MFKVQRPGTSNPKLGTWNLELGTWNMEHGTWNVEPGTRNPEPETWNGESEGWSAARLGGILVTVLPVYLKGCGHLFVKSVTFRSGLRQEGCRRVTGGCRMRMDGRAVVMIFTTAGGSNCYTFSS
jgi:hypothetical protein